MTKLSDLVAEGKAYAERILVKERQKELLPFFHLVAPEGGQDVVIATPWENDIQKKLAVAEVKSMAHKIDAQAVLFISEAWMLKLPAPLTPWHARRQQLPIPSQSPDRVEIVMIVANQKPGDDYICAALQIVRDKPGGRIIALVEDKEMPGSYESWMFENMFRP